MDNFEKEVEKYAKKNIINKLEKQGINYKQLTDADFNDFLVTTAVLADTGVTENQVGKLYSNTRTSDPSCQIFQQTFRRVLPHNSQHVLPVGLRILQILRLQSRHVLHL